VVEDPEVTAGVTRKALDKIHDDTEYYDHQISGVRQMSKMQSFILADEMGLGKSLQALTVAAVDFQRGYAQRILIVCPAFLKWNWLDEIEKHSSFTAEVYHGTPKKREEQRKAFSGDILICGYEQVVNDYEGLAEMEWDILICDEAHAIKEPRSKRTKAIHRLDVGRVFLLTGSPVLNRPNELWSLLHRVDPARFKSYWAFSNRYCVYGGFKNKQIMGVKNKQELRDILGEYMIRRLKEDVLDLPEKQVIPVFVDLHPEQKKVYDEVERTMALSIPDDPEPMEIENILTKMLRLKQIATTPATLGFPDNSYKLDRAMEMIQEFTQDAEHPSPVVVFTQFRGVMEAMRLRLDSHSVPSWQLHGDVPNDQRIPMTKEWAASPVPGVLMVMLQMGVGLNLTAARKAIFLDRLYVPKLNEQAEDRLHRIGADLTQPVQIFSLIARGTVEERIERILNKKRALFKTLVEDVAAWKEMLMKELKETA
jgi:SNF2 family DNA or RNA helicase